MASAPEQAFMEVPGEVTLLRTVNIPPERVVLPLEAGPHIPGLLLVAGVFGVLGVPLLLGGLAALLGLVASGNLKSAMVGMLAGGLLGLPGTLFTGIALVSVSDLLRGSPLLVLDADGFRDIRLRHAIAWSDVRRARIVVLHNFGLSGVELRLRHPIGARHNGFRLGAILDFFRRQPDRVYVPVLLLNVKRHTITQAITTLVQRHGGEIVSPDGRA